MNRIKRIAEWIVIVLFITVIVSVSSIQIYRSVVNSDWYIEKKAKKIFFETVEKVNNPDHIKYIKIDDNTEEIFVYDAPVELFDDLHVKSYEQIEDIEKLAEIWSQNCVTVFFNDGTATSFFITHSGEIYWGT
ncbi:MAG: hypothetical protein IKD07_06750, partial [Clostridia bacterium]|nr:hypothetical protein [Clostridia bacterium]